MKEKNITCIICPLGCIMSIKVEKSEYIVLGNKCERGKKYAIEELTNPSRILTTTVKVNGSNHKRLPVRSNRPIPKNTIFRCVDMINRIEVDAPITLGDTIITNILGLEVDIIASRSIKE